MWHETIASRNVLDYVKSHGTQEQQQEAYRILYPDYGGSWGGQVASFLPYGNVFGRLAGATVGHAANGVRSIALRKKQSTSLPKQSANEIPVDKRQWRFH